MCFIVEAKETDDGRKEPDLANILNRLTPPTRIELLHYHRPVELFIFLNRGKTSQ